MNSLDTLHEYRRLQLQNRFEIEREGAKAAFWGHVAGLSMAGLCLAAWIVVACLLGG